MVSGKRVKTNWASTVIHHIILKKIKRVMWLPYGHSVPKVLKHISFIVKDEEIVENSIASFLLLLLKILDL